MGEINTREAIDYYMVIQSCSRTPQPTMNENNKVVDNIHASAFVCKYSGYPCIHLNRAN